MKPIPTIAYAALALLFLVPCQAPLMAQQLPPVRPADYRAAVKVACVGDSITQGSGVEKGKDYPAQLQQLLGSKWEVRNFGLSGRTLMRTGDRPYWNEPTYTEAREYKPDVVIIMLGTNDTKPQNWVNKQNFETDYRDLAKSFQELESKPRLYFCRPVPVPAPGNFGINEAGIQEQIPIVDKLAAELGAGIIDMHATFDDKTALLPDRVHPNREGAGEMARTAFKVLTGKEAPQPVRPNSLFRDGAVLQHGAPVPVWGTAENGTRVTVSFAGQSATATAAGGKWKVVLKPLRPSSEPQTMTISGGPSEVAVGNVLVGDVWVAGGQSNMAMTLGAKAGANPIEGAPEAIQSANLPMIREFKVPQKFSKEVREDVGGAWTVCTPKTAGGFSAVAFFFARDLQPKIGVPVGILTSSWGGTFVEAWTSPESLAGQSIAIPELKNQHTPSALYQAMIAPVTAFPVKGVIWYQGESNNPKAEEYPARFSALIADWRKQWSQPALPFLFVQIAPFRDMRPEIREAQLLVLGKTKATAMVVTTDVGDANDIHPLRKGPVGGRLALAARAVAYGEKILSSGPIAKSAKLGSNGVVIEFDHSGSGLEARGGELRGFTIAGADGNFVDAAAVIDGDRVVVSSPQVERPKSVRYGWANVPDVNFFNKEGLPASPFRKDVP